MIKVQYYKFLQRTAKRRSTLHVYSNSTTTYTGQL